MLLPSGLMISPLAVSSETNAGVLGISAPPDPTSNIKILGPSPKRLQPTYTWRPSGVIATASALPPTCSVCGFRADRAPPAPAAYWFTTSAGVVLFELVT